MTSGATQILSVFASISFSVLVAWKTARLFADRYDTEKMTTDELKTIIWRYFTSYWNNRRICSTNRGLPPMIKRQQYYASLKEAAQGSKSLRKMCQLILTISFIVADIPEFGSSITHMPYNIRIFRPDIDRCSVRQQHFPSPFKQPCI